MSKPTSLVTGAAGFIGSNLTDYLLDLDHQVICVDNESADNDKFHWNGRTINVSGDITDYKFMKNVFNHVIKLIIINLLICFIMIIFLKVDIMKNIYPPSLVYLT